MSSRVWIYQADRKLSGDEVNQIQNQLNDFVKAWQAHGNDLDAWAKVKHQLFLILGVDEQKAQASGCSIDSSVAMIKRIEKEFNINLFDRQQFAYIDKDGVIKNARLHQLDELVKSGNITDDTRVFDNLVNNINEFENGFHKPFSQSWHKRMLSNSFA